jgi:hypothetical protein
MRGGKMSKVQAGIIIFFMIVGWYAGFYTGIAVKVVKGPACVESAK